MKKLMAVLGASLAVLAGLLVYSAVQLNSDDAPVPKGVMVEVTPIVDPIAGDKNEVPAGTGVVTESATESDTGGFTGTGGEDTVVEAEEEQWDEAAEASAINLNTELPMDIATHDGLSYAYSTLNDAERTVYDEVYRAIYGYVANVPVSTTDPQLLDKVFNCVMSDHPEIFYVNGYKYVKYTMGDVIRRLAFNANYIYDQGERDRIAADIDTVASGIVLNVSPEASDYDKVKYIYDTLVAQTEYVADSPDNQNVISVFLNKRSVCQGYAKAFQLLINKMGMPCCMVFGTVSETQRHAWNIVQADGEWYYVDVTWGDASYVRNEESTADVIVPDVNYDYLLVPYNEIILTHSIETVYPMPACNSLNDNYYVREGLYLTDYNPDQLSWIFSNALASGQGYVMLKCSDDGAYARVYSELIDNQHIFDFMPGGDAAYSDDALMRKLLFAIRR